MMAISDGLGPYIFYREMKKMRPMREEMDGKVIDTRFYIFPFIVFMIKVLFPICTLTWRVNIYVSAKKKIWKRSECTIVNNNIIVSTEFFVTQLTVIDWNLVLHQGRNYILLHARTRLKNKRINQSSQLLSFFLAEGWQH